MRIAYISGDGSLALFGTSGRAMFIQEMLRALVNEKAEIEIFAARLDGDRPKGLESLRLHKLSLFAGDMNVDESLVLRANRDLRRMLDTSRGGGFHLIYERWIPWSYAAVEYAQSRNIPSVLEVTESSLEFLQTLSESVKQLAIHALKTSKYVIASSAKVTETLNEMGIAASPIKGGIDPECYSGGVRSTKRAPGATFTIGYLGKMEDADALLALVEAFARLHRKHPHARLLIAGDGPAKTPMIQELSRRGLLGTAYFLGEISSRKIPAMLARVDVVVAPCRISSHARIEEAMMAGLPIVSCATDSTQIRDQINGVSCPPVDPLALSATIESLHEDSVLRMRLGSTARRGIINDQYWNVLAQEILSKANTLADLQAPSAPVQVKDSTEITAGHLLSSLNLDHDRFQK